MVGRQGVLIPKDAVVQHPSVPSPNRRQLLAMAVKTAGLGAATKLLSPKRLYGEDVKMPKFNYALCNETFGNWPFEKAFAFIAECGYAGVEIAPFTLADDAVDISAARRMEVRRLAEKTGLAVVGLHWMLARTKGFHLTTTDAAVRRKTSEYIGQLARLCADLGGKLMVLGSPKQRDLAPGMTKEQGMKNVAEVLQAAMPSLEETGTVLAIEPLAPVETNFLTTTADGAAFVERIGSPHCRLHLDCKAMASEPTPIPKLIHRYRDVFVHFHANDPNRQGPGFGKLDFVPIMAALADVDYRGWVSVEVFDYTPGIERLARESIRNLRQSAASMGK
jgi:sugar phosphate isomerase/epimerase